MRVVLVPWIVGRCSLYAIRTDDSILAEMFLSRIEVTFPNDAARLARFIERLTSESYIRPDLLRSELPGENVFAMYNHKPMVRERYNPVRLLCSCVSGSARILIVGGGFHKGTTQPIQDNPAAMLQARLLIHVTKEVNRRIEVGEIEVVGSELRPLHRDSMEF